MLIDFCWISFVWGVSSDLLVRRAPLNFSTSEKNTVLIYPFSSPSQELDLALPMSNVPISSNSARLMLFNALQPPQQIDWLKDQTPIHMNSSYAKKSPIIYTQPSSNIHFPIVFVARQHSTSQELARLELSSLTDFPSGRKVTIMLVGIVGSTKYPPTLIRRVAQPSGNMNKYAMFCNLVPNNSSIYVTTQTKKSLPFGYQRCKTLSVDDGSFEHMLSVWQLSDLYITKQETYAPGNLSLLIAHRSNEIWNRWLLSESSVE